MSLWRGEPLILASRSKIRRQLLEAAGIPVVVEAANIDEREIETSRLGAEADPSAAALLLAREKALAVGRSKKHGTVLGADQTLGLGARRFSKPANAAAAREQLAALSGQTHSLHSAIALANNGTIAFETVSVAKLTMRPLSSEFIDAYLQAVGDHVTASVGAYQLEGYGVHLFERIEGDHFTVLGLPLLPLLAFFRQSGLVVN